MPAAPLNFHASVVVLGDRGIVIAGDPGRGKTQLALALISHGRAQGMFARLVSDDQIFLELRAGRLVAVAPATIAGLVEARGVGPLPVEHEPKAVVDLLVRLVDRGDTERMPDATTESLAGCDVPLLKLASDDRAAAVMAVLGRLALPPFG